MNLIAIQLFAGFICGGMLSGLYAAWRFHRDSEVVKLMIGPGSYVYARRRELVHVGWSSGHGHDFYGTGQ